MLFSRPVTRRVLSAWASAVHGSLRYKSVLVTGGAQGIGEDICRRLAADGYKVMVGDIQVERGEKLAKELQGSFVELDVSVPSQVESAIQKVVDEHGSLDALVNNAGIVGSQALLGDYDIDEWKRIIDININGVFYGLKFGLGQMAKQEKGGSIVNMASTAAFRGIKNLGSYTPAKFAVRGLTHAAAVEYADKKIRINAIGPTTGVETPMIQGWIESMPAQPSDIASACAFLLSEEACHITGHTLPVDL